MPSIPEAYWDAARKLCEVYGHDEAEEILDQAKALARLDSVLLPGDLYKLGIMLSELGGLAGEIGDVLIVTARAHGAK